MKRGNNMKHKKKESGISIVEKGKNNFYVKYFDHYLKYSGQTADVVTTPYLCQADSCKNIDMINTMIKDFKESNRRILSEFKKRPNKEKQGGLN